MVRATARSPRLHGGIHEWLHAAHGHVAQKRARPARLHACVSAGIRLTALESLEAGVTTMLAMRFTWQAARGLAHLETLAGGGKVEHVPLPAREVLHAATAGGARALGLGERTGRIAEGLDADLIALRTDGLHLQPIADPESAVLHARPSDVDWVWVRGRVMKRGGALVHGDLARLRAEADERLRRLAFGAGHG